MVLLRGGAPVASWPLWVQGRLDLSVVDELLRWQLEARRWGCSVRLRSACPQLLELLDLVGLAGLLPEPPLGQVGGEAEGGEEAGVEEVVVPDDPVA